MFTLKIFTKSHLYIHRFIYMFSDACQLFSKVFHVLSYITIGIYDTSKK